MRGAELVHFVSSPLLGPLFGFVFQTLDHEVLELRKADTQKSSALQPWEQLVDLSCILAYHAAKVASDKDVIERGQLQVRGPQVPGELQTFTVRHTAAPVRRAQWARTRRAFIWTQRGGRRVNNNTSCFLWNMKVVWIGWWGVINPEQYWNTCRTREDDMLVFPSVDVRICHGSIQTEDGRSFPHFWTAWKHTGSVTCNVSSWNEQSHTSYMWNTQCVCVGRVKRWQVVSTASRSKLWKIHKVPKSHISVLMLLTVRVRLNKVPTTTRSNAIYLLCNERVLVISCSGLFVLKIHRISLKGFFLFFFLCTCTLDNSPYNPSNPRCEPSGRIIFCAGRDFLHQRSIYYSLLLIQQPIFKGMCNKYIKKTRKWKLKPVKAAR